MKAKLKNLCFLLAFVPFFMSCNSDDNDSVGSALITFDQSSPVTITQNGNLVVTGSVTSPSGTSIESIEVYCVYTNGSQTNTSTIATINNLNKIDNNNYTFRFTNENQTIEQHINDGTISGIRIQASVRNGDTSERTLNIKFDDNNGGGTDVNLSAAQSFQWRRVGGANGTGDLAKFGLKWTENTSSYAIVAQDKSTKMVQLNLDNWNNITTRNNLKSLIDSSSPIAEYRGVSVTEPTKQYNDVLGVIYNGTYYILRIQKSTVTNNSSGTTVVIDGQYKD